MGRSRWRETGASPIGIGLRCDVGSSLPFRTWTYHAPYMATEHGIEIAEIQDAARYPLIFVMPGTRPDTYPIERRQPLEHCCGAQLVTGLLVTTPVDLAATSAALASTELVTLRAGSAWHAELELDDGRQGRLVDYRPAVPLTLRW